MLMTIRKVLNFPISGAFTGGGGAGDGASATAHLLPTHKGKLPIEQIKQRMELVLHDVRSVQVDRLQYKIRATLNVNELWMLRTDLYQAISMLHNQSEAARRINSLLPCFSQWIAAKQLSPV